MSIDEVVMDEFPVEGQKKVIVEVGKLAKQADSAVVVKCDKTLLLITVVCDKQSDDKHCDFLPLHVDYQEKFYAAGKIPQGGKREGKLNDHEILVSRLVDRCIRPSFEKNFFSETQVSITLLSSDEEVIPESLAGFGTSLALLLSPAAFVNPVSEVFVYLINDEWKVNPSKTEIKDSAVKLVVGGNDKSLIMLEGISSEISEEKLLEGINIGMELIKKQCEFQRKFIEKFKNIEKIKVENDTVKADEKLANEIFKVYSEKIKNRIERDKSLEKIFSDFKNKSKDENCENVIKQSRKVAFAQLLNEKKVRIDGRKSDEIRDISCEIDYLPVVHGSALFTRGETQALATVTLGDKKDEAFKEGVFEYGVNKVFLHYNFPGYAVGETTGLKSTSRREIGHGTLALNGLKAVMPTDEISNLYTIRIVSEILSSNGSSSMATVCASSLALMDAGIQLKKSVAGIAMGLVFDEKSKDFTVLSDINADEDDLGNMDFKVVGTDTGITAIQLDVKSLLLNTEILYKALQQAKEGRLHILDKMNSVIKAPRPETKDFAPAYTIIKVSKKAIGQIIGIGGSNIQNIMREFNSFVYIEEKSDCGNVKIYGRDHNSLKACTKKIEEYIILPTVGEVYDGVVKIVQDFAVYVEFLPGKIGLLKIQDLDWCFVQDLPSLLHIGDRIEVKLMEIHGGGKYILSHKVLLPRQGGNGTESDNCKKDIERVPDNI